MTVFLWLSLSVPFSVQVSLYVSLFFCVCVSPLHTCLSVSACVCIFHVSLCSPLSLSESVCVYPGAPLSQCVPFPSPPNSSLSVTGCLFLLLRYFSMSLGMCVFLCVSMHASLSAYLYMCICVFFIEFTISPRVCISFLCLGFFL